MPTADLSVVMPNYNHARYLPRALDAIFAQSVQPREVLVLDDASTDDSVSVIDGYARRFPHLRLVRNEKNLGVVRTMNRGAQLAVGRFLGFPAADDFVLPGFYEKTVAVFERHPQAGLCCAYDSFQFGDAGEVQPNPSGWPADRADYYPPDEVARLLRHTIPGHSGIFRRDALEAAGWFDPNLAWYCDWFVNLTLAFRHGACHVPEPLAVRVLLPENYSAAAKPGEKHRAVLRAFLDKITAPDHADVAPLFRRNGAACYFGPDLVRAAATRPDCWTPAVLSFLNGLSPDQYQELLADADPTVRDLAGFFLGPFWQRFAAERAAKEQELQSLRDELAAVRRQLPPEGTVRKVRWVAGLVAKRLGRRAG